MILLKSLKIKRVESFKKQDLIYKILDTQAIVVSESKAAKKEGQEGLSSKKENSSKETRDKEAAGESSTELTPQQEKARKAQKGQKARSRGEGRCCR